MTKKKKQTIKIYHYVAKKRYLNGKSTYTYERMFVPIPTILQNKLLPYCNSRLEIDMIEQNSRFMIILDPVKTFSYTKKPP